MARQEKGQVGLADRLNRRRNLGYTWEKERGAREREEEDSRGQPASHTSSQGVNKREDRHTE